MNEMVETCTSLNDQEKLNANRFYCLIKQKLVFWKLFSSATLGRFDLYYSRNHKQGDKTSVRDFFENSHKKLQKTNRNVSYEKNSKGLILKIGNRKSNHYSRIYQTKNALNFEYEMKGRFLRYYHSLLVSNSLEEFENQLSRRFLDYFGKLLPLHYPYLDWLVIRVRPLQKQNFSSVGLKLDYLTVMEFQPAENCQEFFNLLRLLSYAQNLDYEVNSLTSSKSKHSAYFRIVTFRVRDFLRYIGASDNQHQFDKIKTFLRERQKNSLIEFFSDRYYRGLVTIPLTYVYQNEQNTWVAEVWIAEELFYYAHPFLFPDLLRRKLTKHELVVYYKVMQILYSESVEKIFPIKEFLETYPSVLSNYHKTKIKKYFIQLIQKLEEQQFIESNYKIISNGHYYPTKEFNTRDISEGFVIYEKISI